MTTSWRARNVHKYQKELKPQNRSIVLIYCCHWQEGCCSEGLALHLWVRIEYQKLEMSRYRQSFILKDQVTSFTQLIAFSQLYILKFPVTLHLISHLSRSIHIFKWNPKAREQLAATDTQKNTLQNSGKDASVQEHLSAVLEPQPI